MVYRMNRFMYLALKKNMSEEEIIKYIKQIFRIKHKIDEIITK